MQEGDDLQLAPNEMVEQLVSRDGSSLEARLAHNQEVAGSSPARAIQNYIFAVDLSER